MDRLRLGILFATQGAFGAPGRDARRGAELAVSHLRDEGNLPFEIDLICAEPEGSSESHVEKVRMLLDQGCRQVFGTVTSQARKDVIPVIEKHDAQLWYVCPYEGFEANENVIYAGACPNQHLLPLFDTLLPRYGKRVYLTGANYIWGWEMNRLAREIVIEAGGQIVGERCLPIEETDVSRLIAHVESARPDFILNNLIGPSSYAFLRAMKSLAGRDDYFSPQNCPVVSCDLTECELDEIGLGVADGQLSAASYFDSLTTMENLAFKNRTPSDQKRSSFFATSYASVRMCVSAVLGAGSDDPAQIRNELNAKAHPTVLGELHFDAAINHAGLPFHLGRIEGDSFTIVKSLPMIAADPYLTRLRKTRTTDTKPKLRVVS
jgi:branched-chain amino acid transport system substrate-binding protein